MAAGWLVAATGQSFWDTFVALAIGVFVAVRAIALGRQVVAVLGQHVPEGIDSAAVTADLAAIDGVRDVHDLHLWTLTSGMNVATAHLHSGPAAPGSWPFLLPGTWYDPHSELAPGMELPCFRDVYRVPAEQVDGVIGVDTHRDSLAAFLEASGEKAVEVRRP
ncbi:hypothetical protein FHR32_008165 [Streptosporangium album]|uniref:Cation efflux protein cytoplasmic domain-containing protein n=1 Tax=Streptosporangium album TaxID=47479 RepID=A0A7W7S4J0_9ACTN|nr:hypothetical protein [Streptosporangium album]MBB4943764.1 hypothetical protein [Streptosporangium album]